MYPRQRIEECCRKCKYKHQILHTVPLTYAFLKICAASTDEELVAVMSEEEALSKATEAGYMKPLSRLEMSDKHDIISVLTTYHLFIKAKAAMDQFKEGLEFFGIYNYIVKYPDLLRPLFVNERTLLTFSKCLKNACYSE